MAAYVLGNGVSRRAVSVERLMELGWVYGCNAIYRDHAVTVLVATDLPISTAIQDSGYSRDHRFYTRRPRSDSGALPVPQRYYGFSSGPIAAALAAQDGADHIYLIGFDMAPDHSGRFNNVYAGTEHYKAQGAPPTFSGNWVRQLTQVIQDYPDSRFIHVADDITAEPAEFARLRNHERITMIRFLKLLNK
jgi:hypothetical protein